MTAVYVLFQYKTVFPGTEIPIVKIESFVH